VSKAKIKTPPHPISRTPYLVPHTPEGKGRRAESGERREKRVNKEGKYPSKVR